MAERAEQLRRIAVHRENKVPIKNPEAVKSLVMILHPYKEICDDKGRVVKVVGYMECHARLNGMRETIDRDIDVEVGEHFGVKGEIDQGISPAGREFLDYVIAEYMRFLQEKSESSPTPTPGVRPLPSDRPKDEARAERMRAMNAANAAARVKGKTEEAPEVAAVGVTAEVTNGG